MNAETQKAEKKPVKMFPVKLLRGYRPIEGGHKLKKGQTVTLPYDEALSLIKRKLAERNDPINPID